MTSMPQNTAEFQFYKYKSLMKFCVGERIEVKDRQHRWKCKGVVASIDSFEPQQNWLSMISNLTKYHTARKHREKFIVIALDECIHVQYDDLEAHYAAQLRLNPQQVVIVTNTLSRGNNIDIGHIMQSSSNGGSSTELLVCMMCQRVKCTNNMFMISTNEVLCKTHLCPWDDIAKLPITSAMYPLYHFTQEKIEEIGLSVMNMETKCLAFAKDWGTIKATELVSRIFSDEMLIITYTKAPEARVFKQELSWYQVEESLLKGCLEILKKKLVEEAKLQEEFAMEAVEPSAPEESQREEEGGGTLEQSVVALSTTNAATDANRRNSQDNYNNYQMESSWKVIDSNENFMMLNEVVILELQHPPMCLVLEAGMTYDDLMLMLQGNIPTFDSSHALLYIKQNQDMYGHYQQLVNQTREEVEGSPGYNLGIHQLKVTEQAFLQLPTDACGPILMFSSLPSEFKYNSSMVTKHGILNEWYHGYRKIRGDGNCYYRAVMIGLLEQVLSIPTNNTARYDKLTSLMEVVNLSNVPAKKLYEMLEDARGKSTFVYLMNIDVFNNFRNVGNQVVIVGIQLKTFSKIC